ncbi:hypothetical protein THASP1DRAFT_32158 [Thamnocephalis sphaerospora]|uniref:Uncharacterized protein n=1 Tax=Thamnocephalis sphaerospora TaxID=78915 RepID=A0A4P9XJR0_9FUNG|nr:hypothetical protein THASP1DRAFT_32158 [Thamnocephalis sphaerospora]|eukprot:RKP06017.1 hypothetical protein THASP1DRAFT_32158 [Thamnocephalis sphaerospora]
MSFFKSLMPGAKRRRAEKLANTVRDLIVGQQAATLLYASSTTITEDGAPLDATALLALAAVPVGEVSGGSDGEAGAESDSSTAALASAAAGSKDKRRVAFSGSTKAESSEAAQAKLAATVTAGADDKAPANDGDANNDKAARGKKSKHQHRHRHHRKHKKHDRRRAQQREKALKRLQQPDTLSAVLDILRLMPNPFKTQSLMQQMFQHDWRSMSMPDLLAAERRQIAERNEARRRLSNGSDDTDEDLPPEAMEARTYWWGYEIYIPPRMLQKLEDEGDVATGVLYFLGALSKTVPLIYPFVNMIATFVAMQFTIIKAADRGNGIILVATWVLPIVLIPKPWEDRFRETLRERIPIDV